MRLKSDPGAAFSYSNAGFELLGLLLSRVAGKTFENAVKELVLDPLGMRKSTFLRADVPAELAASPHVGMPLTVPDGAYPYTRRHAPSSTLHSNLEEMCRWMVAHFESAGEWPLAHWPRLDAGVRDLMWQPVVDVGEPPWEEASALAWAVGSYRRERTLSHSGSDPGFGSKLVLVPERRTGVVVLANSNTLPTGYVAGAALEAALADVLPPGSSDDPGYGVDAFRAQLPPVVVPVAEALGSSGAEAARATYSRLAALDPPQHDLDDEVFVDAVWGAIELHRTSLVWPLLRLWTELRPESSAAWTMSGWAHQVDGQLDLARGLLRRALELDPDNDEAAQILTALPSS